MVNFTPPYLSICVIYNPDEQTISTRIIFQDCMYVLVSQDECPQIPPEVSNEPNNRSKPTHPIGHKKRMLQEIKPIHNPR